MPKQPLLTEAQIRAKLVLTVKQAANQEAFATLHGLDQSYLSKVLSGHKPISATIARLLGYEIVRMRGYRPIPPSARK